MSYFHVNSNHSRGFNSPKGVCVVGRRRNLEITRWLVGKFFFSTPTAPLPPLSCLALSRIPLALRQNYNSYTWHTTKHYVCNHHVPCVNLIRKKRFVHTGCFPILIAFPLGDIASTTHATCSLFLGAGLYDLPYPGLNEA